MSKQMVGIDLGEKYLKLVVGSKDSISKVIIEPMPDNYIHNGRMVSGEAMGQFLKPIIKENKLNGSNCALLLPYEDALLRRTAVPGMTRSQLELNLPYEFRSFIQDGLDKYFYDYMLLEKRKAADEVSDELDIVAAAVKKETIENYREMLRQAGLKLKVAIPKECAYSNMLREHIKQGGAADEDYCVVDLGYQTSRVHIFSGMGFEVTRTIDFAGHTMDGVIANMMDVDRFVASNYKENNYNQVQTSEDMQAVYRTIALEIMKAINFYGFNKANSNITKIYFCGGGANIAPLLESIQQATGLPGESISALLPASDSAALFQGGAAAGSVMQ